MIPLRHPRSSQMMTFHNQNDDLPHPLEPCEDPPLTDNHTPSLPLDDPLPAPSTYDNVTGPKGQQQRKRQRANQPSAKTDRCIARSRSKRHALTALAHCVLHRIYKPIIVYMAAPSILILGRQPNIVNFCAPALPTSGLMLTAMRLAGCSKDWVVSLPCQPAPTVASLYQNTKSLATRNQRTSVLCALIALKKQTHKRVRWTAGGDKIFYVGNVTTKTADITTAKCLFNSVLSTPSAQFMTMDLADFYLESHMPANEYEYVRIPIWMIPANIQTLYNLQPQIIDGHVFAEIRRGMYGLPQAGKLANDQLQAFLAPHGYVPCPITPGLWKDTHSDLMFTLVVDDFGVRYSTRQDADKLLSVLSQKYRVKADWTGCRYIGLTLAWDYTARTLNLSMPGYIERALQRFSHPKPTRPQNSPHEWIAPNYGARKQYATQDFSPALDVSDKKRVQEVLGTLLYYARAIDSTMLPAIGTLATQQSSPTTATMNAITHLLNYCATHPEATLRYIASDMILHVESDASYLSKTKGRSRAAGIHYLTCRSPTPTSPPDANSPEPPSNGALFVHCQILKEVLSSAAEAELAALFHNSKEAYAIRNVLTELGHSQPPTPIITDNSTASGIVNDTMKQKRSKAMDMRFYWVRDRVRQGQFIVYWKKGSLNRADYFT